MNELEYYQTALTAVSDLYISMHVLDLQEKTYHAIKTNEYILKWSEGLSSLQEILTAVMSKLATEDSRQAIVDFTTLDTLEERMGDQKCITTVFNGRVNGWCNAKFVRMDDEKPMKRVMYIVENVNSQMKELETLKKIVDEQDRLQNITSALLDEYSTVGNVNLDGDTMEIIKLAGRIKDLTKNDPNATVVPYSDSMQDYINKAVFEEDKELVKETLSIENILRELEHDDSFSLIYRSNLERYGEVKVIQIGKDKVLMGFADKHEEISMYNNKVYIDSPTKIKNRKFLDEQLWRKHCTALAMMDIDKFKGINDTYGHQCGDDSLAAVAEKIQACVRNSDYAIRYGGDEFLIAFTDIPKKQFSERLEKLRKAAEKIVIADYPDVKLTVSIGGVYGDTVVGDMIAVADKALYESKKTRNCVTVF